MAFGETKAGCGRVARSDLGVASTRGHKIPPVSPKNTSLLALVLLAVLVPDALGHELEIDQLRFWLDPKGKLHAQLTFDPELTRAPNSDLPDSDARARARTFARANISAEVNGSDCPLEATTRELYVPGGAAAGDVVMLQCAPSAPVEQLRVRLGPGFVRLAVEVVGFTPTDAAAGDALSTTRVLPGGAELLFSRHSQSDQPKASPEPAAVASWPRSVSQFLLLGIEHIVPGGLDHVLFVLGLALRQARLGSLAWELGAFTLAHTLTFGLGSLGWIDVSAAVVEPVIALSIVVVALNNLRPLPSENKRPRALLCFGFGLIHGLGFAGALGELGMSQGALLPALLGFNLGVEVGQLLVAGCALLLLELARRVQAGVGSTYEPQRWEPARRHIERAGSVAIAALGLYLLFDRS